MVEPIMTEGDLGAYQSGDKAKLLAGATLAVRNYCHWHITPVLQTTARVSDPGRPTLLPTLRLVSLDAVTINDEDVPVEACKWEPDGVLLLPRGVSRWDRLEVTMTHGFDDADDLKAVLASMVQRATTNPESATQLQSGSFSISYPADMSAGGSGLTYHQRSVLDNYRIQTRP